MNDVIRAGALVGTSLISSLAGVALAGQLGSADPNTARAFLLPQTRQVTRGTAHRGAAAPEQIEGRVVQGALFPPPHEHRSSRRLHVAAAIEAEEGEHVGEAAGLIRIDGQTGASERPPEQHHVAD